MEVIETIIVGGGPAGLSAALLLGRCRRRVVIVDSGRYRNAPSSHVRGFLTRDGVPPGELRGIARAELAHYPSVELTNDTVVGVKHDGELFAVEMAQGGGLRAKTLLLATGVIDTLPRISGAQALHGDRVFPCMYCDGWEQRDQPLAAYSYPDLRGVRFANALAQFSRDIVLCADAPVIIDDRLTAKLQARGVRIEQRRPVALTRDGIGVRVEFDRGEALWRRAVFYHLGCTAASALAMQLDLAIDPNGRIVVDGHQQASIPGVFAAGDTAGEAMQAVVAAGEGSAAGIGINEYLTDLP
jgi:thioredoxin reductase